MTSPFWSAVASEARHRFLIQLEMRIKNPKRRRRADLPAHSIIVGLAPAL
jgi:hypothetical protein